MREQVGGAGEKSNQELQDKLEKILEEFHCSKFRPTYVRVGENEYLPISEAEIKKCPLCQEQYGPSYYHCPYEHVTFDISCTRFPPPQEIKSHHEKVRRKGNRDEHNQRLSAQSNGIKLGKSILIEIEQAIPKEAFSPESEIDRNAWLMVLKLGDKDGLINCLLEVETRIKRDWLDSSRFNFEAWRKVVKREFTAPVKGEKEKEEEENQSMRRLIQYMKRLDHAILFTKKQYDERNLAVIKARDILRQRVSMAKSWGYVPGDLYLDTKLNIVCRVQYVGEEAGLLHVVYGRQLKYYNTVCNDVMHMCSSMSSSSSSVAAGMKVRKFTKKEAAVTFQHLSKYKHGYLAMAEARPIDTTAMMIDSLEAKGGGGGDALAHSPSFSGAATAAASTGSGGTKRKQQQPQERLSTSGHKKKNCSCSRRHITMNNNDKNSDNISVCTNFELCLDCFASGYEVDSHKKEHKYYIKENVWTPIYEPHWGADEELALLDAIRKYGFGNWTGIASRVTTKVTMRRSFAVALVVAFGDGDVDDEDENEKKLHAKHDTLTYLLAALHSQTALECRDHYSRVYLQGPSTPYPDPAFELLGQHSRIAATSATGTSSSSSFSSSSSSLSPPMKKKKTTATTVTTNAPTTPVASGGGGGPLSWGLVGGGRNKSKSGATCNSKAAAAAAASKFPLAPQVGYLIERKDFEVEWDNNAEDLLADMEFSPEDKEEDINLKVRVLEIYNSKLDAREKRKKFVLERGLLQKPESNNGNNRSKEEKEIEQNLRVCINDNDNDDGSSGGGGGHESIMIWARFHSEEEHRSLVEGLIEERMVRKQIEQLQAQV
eukprot:jgi/Bigna1/72862/fgenesh1_pg.21_\